MPNPWLDIPLTDYERHMALPQVGQAKLVADRLAALLATHRPSSLAIIGCAGGPGADRFDSVGALDKWVTQGQAPATLLATRTDGALSRPLCVYPALPRYKGSGDPKLAESFTCK